ncbi:MAG: hypothetical protein ACK4WJ_00355 [Endomicrobiia bacterium]
MNNKEFIKMEAKVLLKSGLTKEIISELVNDGLAKEFRHFAEINNYNITEEDLKKIVIWKFYKKYYQS